MQEFIDQLGRIVRLESEPARIVSLVPSQTELLYSLGLRKQVVGRTKFCVHPHHEVGDAAIIGGTKDFKTDRIKDLNPDLIIANKEENDKKLIQELTAEFPVWVSDVSDLPSALDMISSVGHLTHTDNKADLIRETIIEGFSHLKHQHKYRALYFIWRKPWMVAGRNTFINDMMHRAGFMNIITSDRYPQPDEDELRQMNPEVILLSSEPYPFSEQHMDEIRQIFPQAEVLLVNGEFFSWYGSRLIGAPGYLHSLNTAMSAPAVARSSQNPG